MRKTNNLLQLLSVLFLLGSFLSVHCWSGDEESSSILFRQHHMKEVTNEQVSPAVSQKDILLGIQQCIPKASPVDRKSETLKKLETNLEEFTRASGEISSESLITLFERMDFFTANFKDCLVFQAKSQFKKYLLQTIPRLEAELAKLQIETTEYQRQLTQANQELIELRRKETNYERFVTDLRGQLSRATAQDKPNIQRQIDQNQIKLDETRRLITSQEVKVVQKQRDFDLSNAKSTQATTAINALKEKLRTIGV